MNLHLTHEQLCDLVLAESSLKNSSRSSNILSFDPSHRSYAGADGSATSGIGAAADIVTRHLDACLLCSAELESLRSSLAHFREASVSFAHHEFAHGYAHRSIVPPQSMLAQPLYWAAAVVIFAAALFPLSMSRHHATATPADIAAHRAVESDEALLTDIDQKLSADIPTAMEPLADPTAGTASTAPNTSSRAN